MSDYYNKYVPLTGLITQNKTCPSSWLISEYLTKGTAGKVYNTCCKTDCDFVVKIVSALDNWRRELKTQNDIALHGLTIPIIDAWQYKAPSGKQVVFVMRALRQTLANRIAMLYIDKGETAIELVGELLYRAMKILIKTFGLGYFHMDAHADNFMFDEIDNLYLIDFGVISNIEQAELTKELLSNMLRPLLRSLMMYFYINGDIEKRAKDFHRKVIEYLIDILEEREEYSNQRAVLYVFDELTRHQYWEV